MNKEQETVENRVDLLAAEVALLRQRVDQLTAKVEGSAAIAPVTARGGVVTTPQSAVQETGLPDIPSFEGMSSQILSQVSTASFLLVIALILRTVTDYGLINKQLGAYVGIGYALILLGIGWQRYAKGSSLAPIFTICGSLLMFLVVTETNLNPKFKLLPLLPAHVLLIMTAAATAAMTNRFRARIPFGVGTIGVAISAIMLTFHETSPDFRFLIVTLLVTNLLGHFTVRLEKVVMIRWLLCGLTIFAGGWWTFRLVLPVLSEPATAAIARSQLPWYLVGIGLFGFTYLVIAAWEILSRKNEKIDFYYLALPTLTVLWSFGCAQYVTTVLDSYNYLVNLLGLAISAFHLGVVWMLATRMTDSRAGLGAICNAGAIILALSLPTVAGSGLYALPVLSLAAYALIFFSGIWQSGGARLTSYLLQTHAVVYLAVSLATHQETETVITVGACLIISAVAYLHYHWARQNPPATDIRYFGRFDKKDHSAALLLLLALTCGFFAVHGVSVFIVGASNTSALTAIQSVIINATAAGLVLWGFMARDPEKRNLAILIILMGGFKVMFNDMPTTKGFPLVASVLSFGVATAVLSIFMSRWQKRMGTGEGES